MSSSSNKLTSLSAQLKRLQVPQTSVLSAAGSGSDKRRVSFLYDPTEAANMDSEAVYCLALNGLEQLKAIDRATFESFESTLFSQTSVTFERAVQTKQVNDKLNEEIRRFLVHLSPYFMLKPAHKCLEWLVYRYHIHAYNLDELFMCIMPYHETNYFVRALQMLDLETTTTSQNKLWQWLGENQKKGVPLSPLTLATHLYSDLSFFNFMITQYLDHVLDLWWYSVGHVDNNSDNNTDLQQKHFVNNLNFVFSFLAKLLLESVKQLHLETNLSVKSRKSVNNKQQEAFLAQLLPVLFTGFKSELILYKQTAYLIGAFLFERFKFTVETTGKALFAISKGMSLFRLDTKSEDKMDIDDNNTEENDETSTSYTQEQVDCIKSGLLAVCVMIQGQYSDDDDDHDNTEEDHFGFKASPLVSRNFVRKFIKNFDNKQLDLVYSLIDSMNQVYRVDKFLKCLLGRMLAESVHADHAHSDKSLSGVSLDLDANDDELELVKNDTNVYFRLALKLLTLLNFNHTPSLVDHFVTSLLQVLGKQLDNNNVPNLYVEFHLCILIHKLEDKYPVRFDACLNQILQGDRLSQKQRSYLLTVISCKFNSSRCKSAFKYQSIKSKNNEAAATELNLFMAINHVNEEVRANAFVYILSQLRDSDEKRRQQKTVTTTTIDAEFVKEQLKSKLQHESSPLVLKSILGFNERLFDYLDPSELLGDESFLLRIFTSTRIETLLTSNDHVEEEEKKKAADVSEHYLAENNKWFECREMALHLLFNVKHQPSGDHVFFNILIRIAASLFELKEISLLRKLKSTQFYESMLQASSVEAAAASTTTTSGKKGSFYSTAKPTISKLSAKLPTEENEDEEESSELDEMFEQFLQDSVKYLLSDANKKTEDNLIKIPSYFDLLSKSLLTEARRRSLELIDLVVYELSVRLSAQSLFLTNSAYFLNLALQILLNLFSTSPGHHSVFNLKFKAKSGGGHKNDGSPPPPPLAVNKKLNTASSFLKLCLKQTVNSSRSVAVISQLYTNLFKSLAIQQSNFVPASTKLEIEHLVASIYETLCHLAERASSHQTTTTQSSWFVESVLAKFVQTNFSHTIGGAQYVSPSKSSTNMQSFYYFSFRFLTCNGQQSEQSVRLLNTRIKTLKLYAQRAAELVESGLKSGDLLNALTLVVTWCLTSEHEKQRMAALSLLDKMHTVVSEKIASDDKDKGWIGAYLKKLLKHRQEISVDGTDYVRSRSLNKILDSAGDVTAIYRVLNHFVSLSKNNKSGKLAQHYYIGSDLALTRVKYTLLDLVSRIRDEHKTHLLDSVFNLLFATLNDSSSDLIESATMIRQEKEQLVSLIVTEFVLSPHAGSFLNQHEKHFDFLIGYLNNHIDTEANFLIKHFRQTFVTCLASNVHRSTQFFQNLSPARLQLELVRACFDSLYKSKNTTGTGVGSRYDILISFQLTSAHLVSLFNERGKLFVVSDSDKKQQQLNSSQVVVGTTKQIKKDMLSGAVVEHTSGRESSQGVNVIDWSAIRMILELVQSILVRDEIKMETDEEQQQSSHDTFIDLIPYLFLVLERVEQRLTQEEELSTISVEEEEEEENNNSPLGQIKSLLYLETISLNVLLLVYKLNSRVVKLLDQSKFNIELLMQMLQSKELPAVESSIQIDRLNVQQHILILLSQIASIFPDKVLEHVIIMFIFVGNKLARKDDSYSFQIISQVIKSILPSIVDSVQQHQSENSSEHQPSSSSRLISTIDVMQRQQKQLPYVSSLVCKILQSFVVSLPHMPAHRKTMIFAQLMQIIGLNDYLWITVIQSIDYYLVQSTDLLSFTTNLEQMTNRQQQILAKSEDVVSKSEKKLRDAIKTNLQAMISLFVQFEPIQLIKSSVYLVTFMNKYITNLFQTATSSSSSKSMKSSEVKKSAVYSHLACQLDNYNLLQMKYLAYNMLQFVNDLLTHEDLFTKLAAYYDESKSDLGESSKKLYTSLFQSLLEKILQLVLKLTQLVAQINVDHDNDGQDLKKFHKAILNKTYELMERTINLLDTRQFIDVIKYLINPETTENLIQIRRRALGLLNNKLRKYEPDESERTLLMTMLDDLLRSIQLQDSYLADAEINNQTVLFSIKLICKRIGEHTPLAFVKVLAYLSEKLIDKKLYFKEEDGKTTSRLRNVNLLSSVLLCIGEVCLKLKTNSLKHLGQIMIFNLDVIDFIRTKLGDIDSEKAIGYELIDEFNRRGSVKVESSSDSCLLTNEYKNYELLILSTVTCLLKIVQNMSQFLSPYLHRLVYVTTSLSHLTHTFSSSNNTSDNQQQIDTRLGQLRSMIATLIPLRLLAPILNDQSVAFTDHSNSPLLEYKMRVKSVEYYMHMARMAIKNVSQEDLLANIRILKSMFMNLFNMRAGVFKANKKLLTSSAGGKKLAAYMTKEISKYEDFVVGGFSELTLKLSEDLFRPMFFSLYEWATESSSSGSNDHHHDKERFITFYRATYKLSDKLKSLFVLFASQFVQNAANLLNTLNSVKTSSSSSSYKDQTLLVSVIDTLSNVFLNDTQRVFVNKDRFGLFMEPLVDQLENEQQPTDQSSIGGEDAGQGIVKSYAEFVSQHLGPCIANLGACCANDDAMCRRLNYHLLLKTKSSSVQVRLATLDVLNMFTKKVGDLYNSYVGETIPFLAELMEDPVEDVEEKVQFVITELEELLGENLQSQFI